MAETAFREGHVDADGFRIRYMEAGEGVPLVHLHGAGGLRLTPAHELLARRFRVVAFEMPGFGNSSVNDHREHAGAPRQQFCGRSTSSASTPSSMGTSFGGKAALWLAPRRPAGCAGARGASGGHREGRHRCLGRPIARRPRSSGAVSALPVIRRYAPGSTIGPAAARAAPHADLSSRLRISDASTLVFRHSDGHRPGDGRLQRPDAQLPPRVRVRRRA
jgi:pimeloyl-ACP methyl ester carboxylesterase